MFSMIIELYSSFQGPVEFINFTAEDHLKRRRKYSKANLIH